MKKYIRCIYWCNGVVTEHILTAKEIVRERQDYRKEAYNALQKCEDADVRHIVYYRDERNSEDEIWKAHFYPTLFGLNDEQFYDITQDCSDGFIGVVHRL